jgi:hypothetical protein
MILAAIIGGLAKHWSLLPPQRGSAPSDKPPDAKEASGKPPDAKETSDKPPDAKEASGKPPDAKEASGKPPDAKEDRSGDVDARQSVKYDLLTAFIATALVPLFLSSASSRVLQDSAQEPEQRLVFFSYCLVASLAARPFIEYVMHRVLHATRPRNRTDNT